MTQHSKPATMALTIAEKELLRHTLGLDRHPEIYRNYFCAEAGHADLPLIERLIAFGMMRASHTINQGRDTIYVVTELGKQSWT